MYADLMRSSLSVIVVALLANLGNAEELGRSFLTSNRVQTWIDADYKEQMKGSKPWDIPHRLGIATAWAYSKEHPIEYSFYTRVMEDCTRRAVQNAKEILGRERNLNIQPSIHCCIVRFDYASEIIESTGEHNPSADLNEGARLQPYLIFDKVPSGATASHCVTKGSFSNTVTVILICSIGGGQGKDRYIVHTECWQAEPGDDNPIGWTNKWKTASQTNSQ